MDALTGLTEVDPTIEEIVSTQVQEVLTASAVVTPTIMDMSGGVGQGMDTLSVPKFGHFSVQTKSENVAVDAQVNAFSVDKLLLDKHKVIQFLIEDIASLQAKVGVMQAYVQQAGRDMAAEMDQTLITAMVAGVSASAPDHIIDFASGSAISKGDFLAARKLLNIQNVPTDNRYCLISPLREADILAISEFVRVDESGGSDALRNGRIGKLFGFDVFMSSQADDNGTLFYHQTDACWASQLNPKVETHRDLPNLADRWSISHLYGVKVLDSGKRSVKIKAGGA